MRQLLLSAVPALLLRPVSDGFSKIDKVAKFHKRYNHLRWLANEHSSDKTIEWRDG
jgi:hypothetical protein